MNPIKLDKLPVTFQVSLVQLCRGRADELDVDVEDLQRKLCRVEESADGLSCIRLYLVTLQNQNRVLAKIKSCKIRF